MILVLCLAVLGVLAVTGLAGAYHLSAGASEAVLVAPSESPEDPSVPEAVHERGTSTDCHEPDPSDPDPEGLAGSDAFCGRLVYHANTSFQRSSPPDQLIRDERIRTFDVVVASYVGTYGIATCSPWCFPGGEPVYREAHDVGAALGLTPSGEEAYDADQGWQRVGADVAYPHALAIAHHETDAWEADGWIHPAPDQSFVGHLLDRGMAPIDDERLATMVAEDRDLHEDAVPRVCGFTPDAQIRSAASGAGFCDVAFTWVEGAASEEEACGSQTYVCGSQGPAWHSQVVCSWPSLTGDCGGLAHRAEEGGGGSSDAAGSSLNDYDVWHWVVAPAPSECEANREPGFVTSTQDAPKPYLAHDLDVHAPAATATGVQSSEHVQEAALEQATRLAEQAIGLVGLPPAPEQTLAEQASAVAKDDRVEPNAPADTSQSTVVVDRDAEDPCTQLLDTTEDPEHVDPWVDILDATVYRNLWLDSILGVDPWIDGLDRRTYQKPPVTSAFGDANDAYLTDDEHQDASNRPGPWMYSAGGQLGVFTDTDDDGRYDQAPASRLFEAIPETGAYPLFWDMRTEDGQVAEGVGCRLDAAAGRLASEMADAGYGPRTGLIMVVYKPEPTVLYDWRTSQAFVRAEPGQAYVLLSQALHDQRFDPDVEDAIQAALDRLPEPLAVDGDRVVFPSQLVATNSDFYEQCGLPTGGFHTSWSFTHSAHGNPGATIVTSYLLDNQATDGVIGAEGSLPAFEPGGEAYSFPTGLTQFFDVDPLDGDPSRNTEACSAPSHDGDRC